MSLVDLFQVKSGKQNFPDNNWPLFYMARSKSFKKADRKESYILKLLLFTIILVSFVSRFTWLSKIPQGIHRDEASIGYNAYSIAKTGRDEFGKSLPFIFQSLDDFKLPTVIYTDVPFMGIFGLSDFWVRFPTALFGALTPIALFFLARELFGLRVATLSALSLAVSPWHILFSRAANETTIATFFAVLAVYFLIKLIKKWTINNLLFSLIFFVLAIFTYRTQFIFTPMILVSILVVNYKTIFAWTKREKIISFAAIVILLSCWLFVVHAAGSTRVKDVGLQNSGEIIVNLKQQISQDLDEKPIITRIFHNKAIEVGKLFARNYVAHFDFTYLFFTGDLKSTPNSTPYMGHLLLIDLPFLIMGLIGILYITGRNRFFPLLWIGAGPVASAFTVDTPNAMRNLISSVGFAMIVGLGISFVFGKLKARFVVPLAFGLIVIYFANYVYFVHLFVNHKRHSSPWERDTGMEEMVRFVNRESGKYEKIVFGSYTDLYVFLLYFGKVDPAYIQAKEMGVNFVDRKIEIINLIDPKYYWMSTACTLDGDEGDLYVCPKQAIPIKNVDFVGRITFPDGLPAFNFITFDYSSSEKTIELPNRNNLYKPDPMEKIIFTPALK